ncbi:MAG: patatin-like phospholipase family protein [Bacteroidota bacterium]
MRIIVLTVISLFGFVSFASSQKVGLVLSGGGAKGLSHIGVIKALEENRIPIDYVGGTSMGAIIASLYAIGYSPDEMIALLSSEEFSNWSQGKITQEYQYYFKMEPPDPSELNIGISLQDTIPRPRLPLSLIPNHLMDFGVMQIYSQASAAAGYNFDSLMVPFLCIGSDISNNREVVFRKGDLTQAVRASMTFPMYFRPIIMDGRIMYDGGIYNNFPANRVDEAWHPDVLIGSKAAEGNVAPAEDDFFAQVENMVMKPADYNLDSSRAVLIEMKFKNVSLLSIDRINEFVDEGYNQTLQLIPELRRLIQSQGPDSSGMAAKRAAFRSEWPVFKYDEIVIEGLSDAQKFYVENSIRRNEKVFTLEELKEEYLKLVFDNFFSYLYPLSFYKNEDSAFRLNLKIKPQSPLEAKFGLFFSSSGLTQTFLGLNYRELSEIGMRIKGNIQFGQVYNGVNLGVRFDYPLKRPLFFETNFLLQRWDYNNRGNKFIFSDIKAPYLIQNESNVRFELGMPYSVNGVLKYGLGGGRTTDIYFQNKNFLSTDTADNSNINQLTSYLSAEKNTLNDKQFASEGKLRKSSVRLGYGTESYIPGSTGDFLVRSRANFWTLEFFYRDMAYYRLNRKFSLAYFVEAELMFRPLLSNYYSTIIEAPAFNPGFFTQALFLEKYRSYQYLVLGAIPVYHLGNQSSVKLEVYSYLPFRELVRSTDNTAQWGERLSVIRPVVNGSFTYISPIGPVSFNLGYISGEDYPWIVQFSFGYLIFNKKLSER